MEIIKKIWQKAWWTKLILIGLGFSLWPFVIGGGVSYLLASKIKNSLLKWFLILPILGFSVLFGVAWVAAFISPSLPKKEVAVVSFPTPQATESLSPTQAPSPLSSPTSEPTPEVKGEEAQLILVTKVIDGDTIALENGEVVRYIGIDTPETVHPQKPIQCFGQEASNKNKELVGGKKVRLEKDISERDKYNRLLRYVWVGDVFVNEYLVRQGYAQSYTYPPDVKYQDLFLEAQKEARENNKGLWSACAYFGESKAQPTPKPTLISTPSPQTQIPESGGKYTCDCSKTCEKISSCDEAYFQLNTCGCSARDGDKDGVPCEKICR